MKRSYCIALALFMLTAMLSVSGCMCRSTIDNMMHPVQPTPTPKPTLTPTIVPTSTPIPTVSTPGGPTAKQSSNEVRIIRVPPESEFTFDKKVGGQSENITVIVSNDGVKTAKNVILILRIDDSQRGENLVTHEFQIGDMERGERKYMHLATPLHTYASSVFVQVNLEWGESREYYNPITFIKRAYSVYI